METDVTAMNQPAVLPTFCSSSGLKLLVAELLMLFCIAMFFPISK